MTQRLIGGKTVLALGAMAVCYMLARHAFQPTGFFDRNLDSLGAYVGFVLGALLPWLYLGRPREFGKTAGIMLVAILFMSVSDMISAVLAVNGLATHGYLSVLDGVLRGMIVISLALSGLEWAMRTGNERRARLERSESDSKNENKD